MMQKRKRYEEFERQAKSVRLSEPLNAEQSTQQTDELPPETVDPMQLRNKPAAKPQAELAETEDAAQTQPKQNNHMISHGHAHFSVSSANTNDKSIPPQQQQPSTPQPQQIPYPDGTYPPPPPQPQILNQGHYLPPTPDQYAQSPDFAWMKDVAGQVSGDGIPLHGFDPKWMETLNKTYIEPDLDSAEQTEQPDFHFHVDGVEDPKGLNLAALSYRRGQGDDGANGQGMYDTTPFPGPITLLHTPDVALLCRVMKCFLHGMFGNTWFGRDEILRMECLDLWKLEKGREGYVLLADDACRVSFPVREGKTKKAYDALKEKGGEMQEVRLKKYGRKWLSATIFAVLTPKKGRRPGKGQGGMKNMFAWESDVRFFWCVLPVSPVLRMLADKSLTVVDDFQPGSRKRKQLFVWLRETFLKAVTIPDSDDYKNAMLETDCCPSIIDPDNALKRLHSNQYLHFATINPEHSKDLTDDRYRLKLHPAEREAASLANLKCAEYLLVKRVFFKSFYEDIYRSEKDIDPEASNTVSGRGAHHQTQHGLPALVSRAETDDREDTPMSTVDTLLTTPATGNTAAAPTPASQAGARGQRGAAARRVRVRTETAHIRWLEGTYGLRHSRAKALVLCWKEFGFLDEGRFLDWVRAGGMFEGAEVGEPDEDEGKE